jgi:hypothetical protein
MLDRIFPRMQTKHVPSTVRRGAFTPLAYAIAGRAGNQNFIVVNQLHTVSISIQFNLSPL